MLFHKAFAAAALTAMAFAVSAPAAHAAPMDIFVESNSNRGNIPSSGDIIGSTIPGTVSVDRSVGILGRVQTMTDEWEFTATNVFNISFVDIIWPGPETDDGNGWLDGTDTDPPTLPNSNNRLVEITLTPFAGPSRIFTAGTVNENTTIFKGVAPGTYTLMIEGLQPSPGTPGGTGATYDIKIAAVPLPAAGLMLLAGLGGLAFMRRRQTA